MKKQFSATYIAGSSVLEDQSIHTGHIVLFPDKKPLPELYTVDYSRIGQGSHVRLTDRIKCCFFSVLQRSTSLFYLLTGDLKGEKLCDVPRYKMFLAATLYSLFVFCAVFVAR